MPNSDPMSFTASRRSMAFLGGITECLLLLDRSSAQVVPQRLMQYPGGATPLALRDYPDLLPQRHVLFAYVHCLCSHTRSIRLRYEYVHGSGYRQLAPVPRLAPRPHREQQVPRLDLRDSDPHLIPATRVGLGDHAARADDVEVERDGAGVILPAGRGHRQLIRVPPPPVALRADRQGRCPA